MNALGVKTRHVLILLPVLVPSMSADPMMVPKSNLVKLLLVRSMPLNAKLALGRHNLKSSPLELLQVRMNNVRRRIMGRNGMMTLFRLLV